MLKNRDEERIRRRAAEDAARKQVEAENRRRLAEEQRLTALKVERERLRAQKEVEAEERSREAGRRARERQEREARERLRYDEEKKAEEEREAKERLRKEKERVAEQRSNAAVKQRREQQEKEAKARLVQILVEEREDTIRRNWTKMREQAELRCLKPIGTQSPALSEVRSVPPTNCIHPPIGWARKNGATSYYFCNNRCKKYSFRCPDCNISACMACKNQRCSY